MRRAIGSVLIGIGVFAVILAILLPTVVVPKSKKTPLNLNVTRSQPARRSYSTPATGQFVRRQPARDAHRALRLARLGLDEHHDGRVAVHRERHRRHPQLCRGQRPEGPTAQRHHRPGHHRPGQRRWRSSSRAGARTSTATRRSGTRGWPTSSRSTPRRQTYPFFQTDLGKAFPADYVRTEHLDGPERVRVRSARPAPSRTRSRALPTASTPTPARSGSSRTTGAIVKGRRDAGPDAGQRPGRARHDADVRRRDDQGTGQHGQEGHQASSSSPVCGCRSSW